MKKIFVSFLSVILIMGGSCSNPEMKIFKENLSNNPNTDEVTVYDSNQKISEYILENLVQNKNIIEVKKLDSIKVPENLYVQQIVKLFKLEDLTFALVQGASSNTFFLQNTRTPISGIWYVQKNDKEWKPFFEIKNEKEYSVLNSPFYLWNEGKKLFLLLSDDRGGGSGEGTAKVLVSEDGGKNWKIERCFYFVPGNFFEKYRTLGVNFLPWFRKNLRTDFDKGGIVGYGYEYTFSSSTGNFEIEQIIDKGSTDSEMVEVEECKNIMLP